MPVNPALLAWEQQRRKGKPAPKTRAELRQEQRERAKAKWVARGHRWTCSQRTDKKWRCGREARWVFYRVAARLPGASGVQIEACCEKHARDFRAQWVCVEPEQEHEGVQYLVLPAREFDAWYEARHVAIRVRRVLEQLVGDR